MKNIKVTFHHRHFVYQFKLDLHVFEGANMLSIDPESVGKKYAQIKQLLIATPEETGVLEALSLAFRKEFIQRYGQALGERREADFVGTCSQDQLQWLLGRLDAKQQDFEAMLSRAKELYLFVGRETEKQLMEDLNCLRFYTSVCGLVENFVRLPEAAQNHNNFYIFTLCMLSVVGKVLNLGALRSQELGQCIESVAKIMIALWKNILKFFDYARLTAISELVAKIWGQCLKMSKEAAWVYKKHENELVNSSVLKFAVDGLTPQNSNIKVLSQILQFLSELEAKCENVSDLLLFVTECVNLRISSRLTQLAQALNLLRLSPKNSVYLSLPDNMSQGMGRRVLRLREKTISEQSFQKQLALAKLKASELIDSFNKFKNGKIQARKQSVKYQSEKQRIRRESFIMSSFEEVRHKYEEADAKHHESCKFYYDSKELAELLKLCEQKLKEKDALIKNLEQAVAQFVDVKKKFIRQNTLNINKTLQLKIQANFTFVRQDLTDKRSTTKSIQNLLNKLPLPSSHSDKENLATPRKFSESNTHNMMQILPPPPPPPPPGSDSKSYRGSRGSRNSRDIYNLPPLPPPPALLPELLLPPPPLMTLTPPSLAKSGLRKSHAPKKEIKMINWTTVQISKVKDSFWESVEPAQFNEDELVKFFAKKEDKVEAPKVVFSPAKIKKSLLKPERAKNVEIILKKTRLSVQQIGNGILELDEQILTQTNVQSLLNIMPTPQEFQIFAGLTIPDPDEWAVSDIFFSVACKMTGFAQILKALKFKADFASMAQAFNSKLNEFIDFFSALEKDSFLHSFLSHLLAIGNYMNSDTSRGNAYGFKLQSIEKSYMMLGQDKKTTLLEYILTVMLKKLIQFPQKKYYQSKKITALEILQSDLKQFTKQCRNVQECMLMSGEDDQRTPQVFLSFFIETREKIAVFDAKFTEAFQIFNKVCDFYCEKLESDKMVGIINEFKGKVYQFVQARKVQIKK